ncbi:hypothetical protein [Paenibacillus sacheonensis]|uniref:Uncharacterized protein n=1 Tax=Paenibacillus sacheonensis TaxID=742054 RepID=A0A7X4YPL8_9BACL|nr:hypothetical protein [Paenibacillus sacheonensis]MBM7565032.1 hypothetical protein [Paenibacillus sacheonensis]NBC70183.1 hypothetical protein [Paenibacillus sacheonensis]
MRRRAGKTGASAYKLASGGMREASMAGGTFIRHDSSSNVFVGPSVEGTDKEYMKIISGKVSERKPSFAT